MAKAFAAAGLTELAIRTFERTFEIADAFEEMESGFRDYYRNEAAWHANSLRENQDARYVNAAILARADPKQLRLLHSTFMEAQMLTLLRPGRLSEIDYLNALFGGNGRPIGDPWEGVVRIARMHPNASEGEVVVLSLGKYYKSGSEEARDATDVTEGILAAKKGNGYPQEWAELVARRISGHAAHCGQRGTGVVVCCVPARP